ncbi:MAG: right-handed parallel beta-helix repeat-containing protein [Frankia sp.]|nr:right-handed parallel beta-helix repeat-containing protein [Frankia sp.]
MSQPARHNRPPTGRGPRLVARDRRRLSWHASLALRWLLVALVGLLLVGASAATAGSGAQPSLALTVFDEDIVVVRGERFPASRPVTLDANLVLTQGDVYGGTGEITSGPDGQFLVGFQVPPGTVGEITVTASADGVPTVSAKLSVSVAGEPLPTDQPASPPPSPATDAGPAAVNYPPPDTPYVVGPGERYTSVQAAVNAAPEGATIYIKNGVYREAVTPKSGQTLQGETRDGARISGANLVEPGWWKQSGRYWYFDTPWPLRGRINSKWDGVTPDIDAQATDLLHRDDIPLLHKKALDQIGPDDFYIDYSAKRVYIASDPAGHRFELAVRKQGVGDGQRRTENVTLVNLTVEKTATGFHEGGIEMDKGWTVRDCLVLGHHGRGISTTVDNTIIGTVTPFTSPYPGGGARESAQQGRSGSMQVLYNGSLGIGGSGWLGQPDRFGHTSTKQSETTTAEYSNNIKISGVEIGWSNSQRFSYWDEGGGIKLLLRKDVVVENNWVHDSFGPGVWFDTNNRNITVTGNLIEDNLATGVWYEANPGPFSGGVRISHNTMRRNGNDQLGMNRNFDGRGQYGGVFLSDSADIEVDNNFIETGTVGGFGITNHYGGSRTRPANINVHDNVISIGIPTAAIGFAIGGNNIRFDRNVVLTWGQVNPDSVLFSLGADTFPRWRSTHDPNAAIAAISPPAGRR